MPFTPSSFLLLATSCRSCSFKVPALLQLFRQALIAWAGGYLGYGNRKTCLCTPLDQREEKGRCSRSCLSFENTCFVVIRIPIETVCRYSLVDHGAGWRAERVFLSKLNGFEGGGFAGLAVVRHLRRNFEVTLVDAKKHLDFILAKYVKKDCPSFAFRPQGTLNLFLGW